MLHEIPPLGGADDNWVSLPRHEMAAREADLLLGGLALVGARLAGLHLGIERRPPPRDALLAGDGLALAFLQLGHGYRGGDGGQRFIVCCVWYKCCVCAVFVCVCVCVYVRT